MKHHPKRFFVNRFARTKTMLLVAIPLYYAVLFSSCNPKSIIFGKSDAEKELDYAKRRCQSESMVGSRKGYRVDIDAAKKNLESAKASIDAQKYRTLSQELADYSAEWEILNQAMERACLDYAICDYRNLKDSSYAACSDARDIKTKSENDARAFFEKIKRLESENSFLRSDLTSASADDKTAVPAKKNSSTFSQKTATELRYSTFDYIVTESIWIIDLSGWTEVEPDRREDTFEKTSVERRDLIRKVRDTSNDFSSYFGTNGNKIEWVSVLAPTELASFKEISGPMAGPLRHNYNWTIDFGSLPPASYKIINRFTFYNAFQKSNKEDWTANVKYPTEKLVVLFLFPEIKLCKNIVVSFKEGESQPQVIVENPGTITSDGKCVYWTTYDAVPNSKYIFEWQW